MEGHRMGFILKEFQDEAINELRETFLDLWKNGKGRQIPITFKSPTGSGKTIMMAHFLKIIANDIQFDVDKSFVWFSFNEESYIQSKENLAKYYNGGNELNLLDHNSLNNGKLSNNDVFFINWQKLKMRTKEGRKLRKAGEETPSFDEFINATKLENREIILIIDEAHRDSDTELAQDLIDLIDPRIIIKVTATPNEEVSHSDVINKKVGWVEVNRDKVVSEGLIKEKIVVQTREDLEAVQEKDQDRVLLELAYNKRKELKKHYEEIGKEINPLVLIQLPNDDEEFKVGQSKLEIVKAFLNEKNIQENEIAIWLSDKKENLNLIEKNNSKVSFLLFKQAAATGWDCPRASILVMFREIKSPIFHTQTVGRILRMPEAEHYTNPALNVGYLYTNYERNQIKLPDNQSGKNKPHIYTSERKQLDEIIALKSTYFSRTDYGDLGFTYQNTFFKTANSFFEFQDGDLKEDILNKLTKKGLKVEGTKISNELIVNAEIESYDDFIDQINSSGEIQEEQISKNDLEKLYNLLCYQIISEQKEEKKKYAPERSYGKLKSALNVWLKSLLGGDTYKIYTIIVNDLLQLDRSVLRRVISDSLGEYRAIRDNEILTKVKSSRQEVDWHIPEIQTYTEDYEMIDFNKSIMVPFYIKKEYHGKQNEIAFMSYLDKSSSIEWWYKNGDNGRQFFAVPYFNTTTRTYNSFYVDFIVRLNDGSICLFDTKSGNTANTEGRARGLYEYIQTNTNKELPLVGGIVINSAGEWYYNDNEDYNYNPNDLSAWKKLNDLL